jgi:hypothetical protein
MANCVQYFNRITEIPAARERQATIVEGVIHTVPKGETCDF